MIRKTLLSSTLPFVLLGATTAAAQSTRPPGDVKRADELFREAHTLRDAGKVHEACADFAESQRLDPALGTLLNLADCHQQEGKMATAFGEFEQAEREAREHQDPERESFAHQQVNALAPRLSYVKLGLDPATVVDSLTVDGKLVDRAVWAVHVALDPGPHTFVFAAQGKVSRSVDVVVGEPGVQTVPVPPLASAGGEPPPPVAAPPSALPTEPAPAASSSGAFPLRTVGFVVGGVGIVGVGLGAAFGAGALSSKSAGNSHCSGKFCDSQGLSDENSAHSQATLSTVFFAVGAVALAAGAYLVLTSPSSQSAQVRVAPVVLARGSGAMAEVAW